MHLHYASACRIVDARSVALENRTISKSIGSWNVKKQESRIASRSNNRACRVARSIVINNPSSISFNNQPLRRDRAPTSDLRHERGGSLREMFPGDLGEVAGDSSPAGGGRLGSQVMRQVVECTARAVLIRVMILREPARGPRSFTTAPPRSRASRGIPSSSILHR